MNVRDAAAIVRYFGVPNLLHWGIGQVKTKVGWYCRRLPVGDWSAIEIGDVLGGAVPTCPAAYYDYRKENGPPFFFKPGVLPSDSQLSSIAGEAGTARGMEVADACCKGRFLYFSDRFGDLADPVNWKRNPFTRKELTYDGHWSRAGFFNKEFGDIKFYWEPSRFSWAYWLVRAYALSGEDRYAEGFWRLLESWAQSNQPQRGVNWMSGQEVALRAMAICFAVHAFMVSPSTTPQRLALCVRVLSEHAKRIEINISDAVRQKTNHALSEACGLLTIGLQFPELRGSRRWYRRGRSVIQREALRQIYPDGSYVQHSMNYHRLMLHVMTWASRLTELNGAPLKKRVLDRLDRAGQFLFQVVDSCCGQAPNYGANDGAYVLPLSNCKYVDYRPTLQMARYLTRRERLFEPGPWDEPLLWLWSSEAIETTCRPEAPTSSRFDKGGYYTIRDTETWCMIRCHSYRDRPTHCDPLHVDLWYCGVNVLRDAGTYQYYVPDQTDLQEYLTSLSAHNCIEIDDTPPMRRVSRFVQVPWIKAKTIAFSGKQFVGEHYGYSHRPICAIHRRGVAYVGDGDWRITDEVMGSGQHKVVLRWHAPDGEWCSRQAEHCLHVDGVKMTLGFEHPAGTKTVIHRGGKDGARSGPCESTLYGRLDPQSVLELQYIGILPVRLVTYVSLAQE